MQHWIYKLIRDFYNTIENGQPIDTHGVDRLPIEAAHQAEHGR
ncbi:hypothetical protein [Nitrosomonas aestuarii]|nr:hypothetical protein [Nitrosomonas aestuarii]